jgi:hypothetical protein
MELYDHRSPEKETLNIAEQNPETTQALQQQLETKLQDRK